MARVNRKDRLTGYILKDQESAERIVAAGDELLRSEGIDPSGPLFPREGKGRKPAARARKRSA